MSPLWFTRRLRSAAFNRGAEPFKNSARADKNSGISDEIVATDEAGFYGAVLGPRSVCPAPDDKPGGPRGAASSCSVSCEGSGSTASRLPVRSTQASSESLGFRKRMILDTVVLLL